MNSVTFCRILVLVLLASIISTAFQVQTPRAHAQGNESFYIYENGRRVPNGPSVMGNILEIARDGRILTTVTTLGPTEIIRSLVHDEANRGFMAIIRSGTATFNIERIDLKGVRTTIVANGSWVDPRALMRNGEGEWLFVDSTPAPSSGVQVYQIKGNGYVHRCFAPSLWILTAVIHPVTGNILCRGSTRLTPVEFGFFQIQPDTGIWAPYNITTGMAAAAGGAVEPIYDAVFDGFWDLRHDGPWGTLSVLRVTWGGGLAGFATIRQSYVPADIARGDGRNLAAPFRALLSLNKVLGIYDLDRSGTLAQVGTLPPLQGTLGSRLLRRGSRHLTWFMNQPPHDRTLQVSFPGEPRQSYAVGFSLSGASPGILLRDNRVIPIKVDGLTAVSLRGGLPGVLTGTTGLLDAAGEAKVRVNVGPFAAALKGTRVIATALVLDPNATYGIAQIAGPVGFTVR